MAWRTYINGHEWLGNNVVSKDIFDELKRQGCKFEIDDEGNYINTIEPFQIVDLDKLVLATEKFIIEIVEEAQARFNKLPEKVKKMRLDDPFITPIGDFSSFFSNSQKIERWKINKSSLTLNMEWDIWNSMIFSAYRLLFILGMDNYEEGYDYTMHRKTYTLKPNVKCVFEFN